MEEGEGGTISPREGNETTAFCMWCAAKTSYYRNHEAKSGGWWIFQRDYDDDGGKFERNLIFKRRKKGCFG